MPWRVDSPPGWIYGNPLSLSKCVCILSCQVGKSKGDAVDITTPGSFQTLMVALISVVPSEMQYCVCYIVFVGRGSSCDLHVASCVVLVIALTWQVKEPAWKFWKFQVFLFQLCISQLRKELHYGFGKPTGSTEIDMSSNSIDHLTSTNLYSEWCTTVTLGHQELA